MAKQNETKFKEKVQRDLDTLPKCWHEKINQMSIRGTPDILACINGKFVAIELKTETGKLAPIQAYKLDKICKAGGWAYTSTPSEWPDVFEDLKNL